MTPLPDITRDLSGLATLAGGQLTLIPRAFDIEGETTAEGVCWALRQQAADLTAAASIIEGRASGVESYWSERMGVHVIVGSPLDLANQILKGGAE